MSADPVSTEVAVANAQQPAVAHPATGEILDLGSPTDVLAAALLDAKDLGQRAQAYARQIKDELLRRMDYERTFTARVGGYKVEGDTERLPDYDGSRLHAELWMLVPEALSLSAVANAVEVVPTYKVKKRGVNALLRAHDERVLAAVKAAEIPNTKPRDVRVQTERRT